jgi:hypothetical protein
MLNNYPRGISIYLWLYSTLLDLGRFFTFLILYAIGRTPWTGDQAAVYTKNNTDIE